ncbi:MAG: YkgJ family cysteine cluster protein [Bacteroidia bacterium]
MIKISELNKAASNRKEEHKKLLAVLKKKNSSEVDKVFQRLHDEAFEKIDCLQCANCCKTTSPIFYQRDIERLAKHFRIRPSEFIEQYLHIDEDNDYVLNSAPCPFLGDDNYCSVYDSRPTACREYPHTDRKRVQQIFNLTLKNASVCPAVYDILENIRTVKP